ncbi:MAG: hypothetical protein ABIJ34_09130 [archaeon]
MSDHYYTHQPLAPQSKEMKEIDRSFEVGIDELGTTTNPFEHQTQALKARIFHGASRVEFEFFGQQKGRKEQPTPETFGARERLDMRELAEFNEIETSTHATVGVQGLSGLNMQNHMFSDDQRKQSIDEIKRAIHFAAEATTGGAVVFHTGEAPRYMHGRWKNGNGETMFQMYPEEDERKVTYLTDPISKRLVAQISDVDRLALPVYDRDEKNNINYLKDEKGEFVTDPLLKEFDKIHGGRIPLYKTDEKSGAVQTRIINFGEFKKERLKELEAEQGKKLDASVVEEDLVKDFFRLQRFMDVQYNFYFGTHGEGSYVETLKQREKIIDSLKFYRELKEKIPEKDWWKVKQQGRAMQFVPPDVEDPVEYLEKNLQENSRQISYYKELAIHGRRAAHDQLEMVNRSKLADKFAVEQSALSMAELGVYAWQMTEKAHKDFKDEKVPFDIKNPIYLAPENLFPEMYGSHPDELKEFVLKGREAMQKELVSKFKMKESEAKKLSEQHIRATLDIGHANIWKKYFVSKEGESLESRDKRFEEWLIKKTKELVDQKIVGHLHISDNFGFHDEHLTAGDGNAPIKKFVENAKKAGLKEFIVESGSFNPLTSLPDTWMHFNSPVYGLQVPGFTKDAWTDPSVPRAWNDHYRSYFGRTEGPRYIVGDMSPSEDFKGAPFYSGLGVD